MVNKFAAPKCASGYVSNEKKPSAKFHFSLKIAQLNKQWIHFVSKRDWLATKLSVMCELCFEEKYLRRGEKCTLQCSMNPLPTAYPQVLLSKHLVVANFLQSSQKKILPR